MVTLARHGDSSFLCGFKRWKSTLLLFAAGCSEDKGQVHGCSDGHGGSVWRGDQGHSHPQAKGAAVVIALSPHFIAMVLYVRVQREAESKAKVIESRCTKRLAVSFSLTGLLFECCLNFTYDLTRVV